MSLIADRFVVLLDANVLYSFRKRDLYLRFYQADLFRARWTDKITQEWSRRLLERKPDAANSVARQLDVIADIFPEAVVSGYEVLIDTLDLPDPDDRHVLAAAIVCNAQHIITDNIRDFPVERLEPFDLEAVDSDEFLLRTFELYPLEALEVLRRMRMDYTRPTFTPSAFILDLTVKGLPRLAGRLRHYRDYL